jgi:single-stranded DNA-binding protein
MASVAPSPSQRPSTTQAHYERPTYTLNPEAQRALADLTRKHNLKQLDGKFENAGAAIMNTAAEINERLNNKEVAGRKHRQRQQGSQNPDADAAVAAVEADLEQMRAKVESMTKRMEEGMRKMIDGRLAVEQINESVASAAESARAEASTQASTLATRSQARRRRGGNDEDEDGENGEEEYQDFTPTDPSGGTQAVASVSEGWMRKLDDEKIRYQSLTLGQRYAKHNDYIQFKNLVHTSRFPEGEVELPHASAWFTDNGAAPQPGVTGAGGDEDDDDDIQIQRTKTSTKCPLTLQEFRDPVTSSKCKHSFEASAIMEMIKNSSETVGGQPAARGRAATGEKAVRCPVASCDHMLTKNDLHKDKTIMYHIARLQRARRLEEEDEDDDEGNGSSGRQRVDLIESDAPDVDDYVAEPVVMKREPRGTARSRASVAPKSSRAGGRDEDGDETMEQW